MKIVFDTNIVASASFWRGKPFDCLSAWAAGRVTAVVSAPILSEYFETVEALAARYPARKRVKWAEALTAAADLVFPMERARGAVTDPDYEIFLECAIDGEATHIVSGDKKHLLAVQEWRGVKIITADAFLALI